MKNKLFPTISIFGIFSFLFFFLVKPAAADPIDFCSTFWECTIFIAAFLSYQFLWVIFLIGVVVFLVKAFKKKRKEWLIFAIILLVLTISVNPYFKEKLQIVENYQKHSELLKKLDYSIYLPSYLPQGIVFADWEVVENKGIKDVVIYFGNSDANSNKHAYLNDFSFTQYKNDGLFAPPLCSLENHDQIEGYIESRKGYVCKLFKVTPGGTEIYREEHATPDTVENIEPVSRLQDARIFFIKGSTVITSVISATEAKENTGLSLDELVEIIDSFEEITTEKLQELRSSGDKVKDLIF